MHQKILSENAIEYHQKKQQSSCIHSKPILRSTAKKRSEMNSHATITTPSILHPSSQHYNHVGVKRSLQNERGMNPNLTQNSTSLHYEDYLFNNELIASVNHTPSVTPVSSQMTSDVSFNLQNVLCSDVNSQCGNSRNNSNILSTYNNFGHLNLQSPCMDNYIADAVLSESNVTTNMENKQLMPHVNLVAKNQYNNQFTDLSSTHMPENLHDLTINWIKQQAPPPLLPNYDIYQKVKAQNLATLPGISPLILNNSDLNAIEKTYLDMTEPISFFSGPPTPAINLNLQHSINHSNAFQTSNNLRQNLDLFNKQNTPVTSPDPNGMGVTFQFHQSSIPTISSIEGPIDNTTKMMENMYCESTNQRMLDRCPPSNIPLPTFRPMSATRLESGDEVFASPRKVPEKRKYRDTFKALMVPLVTSEKIFTSASGSHVVKKSGRGLKVSDAEDWTPDPEALRDGLSRIRGTDSSGRISSHFIGDEMKRERNRLASRFCRIKKKTFHEANKIKLEALENEHVNLILLLRKVSRFILINHVQIPMHQRKYVEIVSGGISFHNLSRKICGSTDDFVNHVLENVDLGFPQGGMLINYRKYIPRHLSECTNPKSISFVPHTMDDYDSSISLWDNNANGASKNSGSSRKQTDPKDPLSLLPEPNYNTLLQHVDTCAAILQSERWRCGTGTKKRFNHS